MNKGFSTILGYIEIISMFFEIYLVDDRIESIIFSGEADGVTGA